MRRLLPSLVLLACAPAQEARPLAPSAAVADAGLPPPLPVDAGPAPQAEALLSTAVVSPNGHVLFFTHHGLLEWRPPAPGQAPTKAVTYHPFAVDRVEQPIVGNTFVTLHRTDGANHDDVTIWDATTLARSPTTLVATEPDVPFSDDGTRFALTSCAVAGDARRPCATVVYDEAGRSKGKVEVPDGATIRLSPTGSYALVVDDLRADVLEVATGRRVLRRANLEPLQAHADRSPSVANDSAGRELLTFASDDRFVFTLHGVVEVFDLKTGKVVRTERFTPRGPNTVVSHVLSPDHTRIATLLDQEKTVRIRSLVDRAAAEKVLHLDKADLCNRCDVVWSDAGHLSFGGIMHDTDVANMLLDVATGARTLRPSASLDLLPGGFLAVTAGRELSIVAPEGASIPSSAAALTPTNAHLVESRPEGIRVFDRSGAVIVAR